MMISLIMLVHHCDSQKHVFRKGDRVVETKNDDVFKGNTENEVNVFVGTSGEGHTFPGATLPFGMIQVSPINTVSRVSTSGYDDESNRFDGFVHTCLSGTGIADGMDILITPSIGTRRTNSTLSKLISREELNTVRRDAKPGFYSTRIESNGHFIDMNVVSAVRCAIHQWRVSETTNMSIVVDLRNRFSWDRVLPGTKVERKDSHTLIGKRCTSGWTEHTCVYFTIRFETPFKQCEKGAAYSLNEERIIRCDFPTTRQIEFRVGISFVSLQGAAKNLDECNAFTYDEALVQSTEQWNRMLEKFKGGGILERTALYHSMLGPTKISDVDGSVLDPDSIVRVRSSLHQNTHTFYSTQMETHTDTRIQHVLLILALGYISSGNVVAPFDLASTTNERNDTISRNLCEFQSTKLHPSSI